MKCMFSNVLGFYLVLMAATVFADPANIAGDTYRITNYFGEGVPDAVDVELVFNDQFMERLGPGSADESLLGIEYSIYFNSIFEIRMETGDVSTFAPTRFYIEYDADGEPSLMRLQSGLWTLSADFAASTATLTTIITSPIGLSMERVVDGRPYDTSRPVAVDPEILAMQEAVLAYYFGVVTEDNPNRARTYVHMKELTKLIRASMVARHKLGEQAPSQPWPEE